MEKQQKQDKKFLSSTQWEKEYLPQAFDAERLDSAIANDSHVGAVLAARVLRQSPPGTNRRK
jgi:hypothetical protein